MCIGYIVIHYKSCFHGEVMDAPAVVIDCGSSTCRVGFAGESTPRTQFPTVVGRRKTEGKDTNNADVYIGSETMIGGNARLSVKHPIEYGIVTNWDDMEKLWNFIFFKELGASPTEHPVLLTEPACNPGANREKNAQIMFETFDCQALYVASRPALSLLSTGRTSGLVLSVGSQPAISVPVYERCYLPYATCKMFVSGSDLTYYLMKLIGDAGGPHMNEVTHFKSFQESVERAKQGLCYVSLKYDADMTSQGSLTDAKHKLPDGTVITLGRERFQCPEALFEPSLIGMESPGIHEVAQYTSLKCDKDIRDLMYSNIVLTGRSLLFPGLVARLQDEIAKLVPSGQAVNVFQATANSAWNGGSLFAAASTFRQGCITAEEYDEFGPGIVRKKCF